MSNAGTLLFKPIEQLTLEDFNHIVAVDLRAAYVGCKAVLSHMGKGGRIAFISSNIADHAALPMTSLYSLDKSGLDGLCKGMARDLGPRGITVNTLHPAPINTNANPENGPYREKLKSLMATPRWPTGGRRGTGCIFGERRSGLCQWRGLQDRQWVHSVMVERNSERLDSNCI